MDEQNAIDNRADAMRGHVPAFSEDRARMPRGRVAMLKA